MGRLNKKVFIDGLGLARDFKELEKIGVQIEEDVCPT